MQFHLDGFRPGDPSKSEPLDPDGVRGRHSAEVDVLIVGSGPAGLTLAAQLSRFPEIRTRLVEQKAGPLQVGQADGIACRTLEMFEAFGFCERVTKEGYWVNETAFWKPHERQPAHICRSQVIQDVEEGLSEFPHVILNQARVHDFYLELMANGPARIVPDYSLRLVDLQVDPRRADDSTAYAVTARLAPADDADGGTPELVRARYVVGCDGARSAVRHFMGLSLEGDSTSQAWGVMDVLAITDFPDIRRKVAIHSAKEGSMLIIPREGGYLVRMYIELSKLAPQQRVSSLNVTSEALVSAAQRILKPFRLEVKEIAWWSVYEIGQRLCRQFDDRRTDAGRVVPPRVFIAGDACHTHSPKAGQGMNVSMQDAFNLGWKLAAVLTHRVSPGILFTYSEERHAIAKELIDFDHELARLFSARPRASADAGDAGVDPAEFQRYFIRAGRFTAGTATHYRQSLLTGPPTHQHLARGFVIGTRFHSAATIRLADAKSVQLGHTIRADGRWRLFAFAALEQPTDPTSRLGALCDFLDKSPDSPLRRHTRDGEDLDSVIELMAVCQQPHRDLSTVGMPALLLPRKGRFGLVDYEKIFCADTRAGHDIFDLRQVDRQRGVLVVVRPDQYIAHLLPLDAHGELGGYFRDILSNAR